MRHALGLLIATVGLTAAVPTVAQSLVEQGHYIATAAGCEGCHTTAGAGPYSGGDALKTPFGAIYGPNITSDPRTGIGGWTLQDFDRAVRRGVGKGGELLYPAMPYTNFSLMTDADLNALWAYIHSIPAVSRASVHNTFAFPFNVRPGLWAWQKMYFDPGRFAADPKRSAQYNRGAYLSEALAHCDACHTPRNFAQATVQGQELAGGHAEGWYAPDISTGPQSDLKAWTVEDLEQFFKTGRSRHNSKVIGPMQQVVHAELAQLTDADRTAIAVYLKQAPAPVEPSSAKAVKLTAVRLQAGKSVYDQHCVSCHKPDGRGQKGVVPALAGDPTVTANDPDDVIMAMLEGFKPDGTWGAMGSFAKTLNDEQIADVANYVRTSWNNAAAPNASERSIQKYRDLADPQGASQREALLCPDLPVEWLKPALQPGPDALRKAATDRTQLDQLIKQYRTHRPGSSRAEVVEALSAAYCRAVSTQNLSQSRAAGAIARFTQQVAVNLSTGP